MQGILYFTLMLLAVGFAIIVFYICYLLMRVAATVESVGNTAHEMEEKMKNITPEIENTIKESSDLVDDIYDKIKATDSVVDTVENIGTSVHTVNQVYKIKRDRTSDEEIFEKAKPFIEGIKWSEVATQLYSNWKEDKPSKPSNEKQLVVQHEEKDIIPLKQTGKEG